MFEENFACPFLSQTPPDWDALAAAFAGQPGLPLRQAWRAEPEPGLRAGIAKAAYTAEALLVYAEMKDDDVFNPVAGFNEPAFLKGDVVEIFVLTEGAERYAEIHSTPEGSVMQLRFAPGWRAEQPPGAPVDFQSRFIVSPVTQVRTRKTAAGWSALLEIPFALLEARPRPGAPWRMAVCRYDYTRGQERPVLSSTAALPRIDFHLPDFWNPVVFDPAII